MVSLHSYVDLLWLLTDACAKLIMQTRTWSSSGQMYIAHILVLAVGICVVSGPFTPRKLDESDGQFTSHSRTGLY
jgi:hypothetical protein